MGQSSEEETHIKKTSKEGFWSLLGKNSSDCSQINVHTHVLYIQYALTGVLHLGVVLLWFSLWLQWWKSLYIRVCVCVCQCVLVRMCLCVYSSTRLTGLSYSYISIKDWRASCEGILAAKRWLAPSCQVHITPLTCSTRKSKLTLCSRQHVQFYWPEKAHSFSPPNAVKQTSTYMLLWAPWHVFFFLS